MKKLLAIILAALMLVPMLAACDRSGTQKGDYKVAMITDYGDITDQSFNQTTYEACKEYCDANKIDFQYFKPAGDSTEERVAKVEEAIDGGYNIIVMPGFAFAGTLYQVQDKEEYKDVKFIALDVSEYDLFDCFYKHDETGARAGLIDENNKEHISENVYCAVYKEELCGYMAGYAAVKLGYTHLGFLGGMLASNYDVKTVFIDAFLKLIKIDLADAKWFFDSLEKYAQKHDVTFVLSVSADPEALPDFCKGYII